MANELKKELLDSVYQCELMREHVRALKALCEELSDRIDPKEKAKPLREYHTEVEHCPECAAAERWKRQQEGFPYG
jgi:nucleotidyltransferase/DNA polymerase involved in DNA repair